MEKLISWSKLCFQSLNLILDSWRTSMTRLRHALATIKDIQVLTWVRSVDQNHSQIPICQESRLKCVPFLPIPGHLSLTVACRTFAANRRRSLYAAPPPRIAGWRRILKPTSSQNPSFIFTQVVLLYDITQLFACVCHLKKTLPTQQPIPYQPSLPTAGFITWLFYTKGYIYNLNVLFTVTPFKLSTLSICPSQLRKSPSFRPWKRGSKCPRCPMMLTIIV